MAGIFPKRGLHIAASELLCKNCQEFYGNPSWSGYCSKCNRELLQKSSKRVARSVSDASEALTFSKFEEKKKQQSDKRTKTLKNIITKRGTSFRDTGASLVSREQRQLSQESLQVTREFQEFLKSLPDPCETDAQRQTNAFLNRLHKSKLDTKTVEEISELVQDFYQAVSDRFQMGPAYRDLTSEQIDQLMDLTERYLMTRLYRSVFPRIAAQHEEKDLKTQTRIRSLNWVTPQHLETDIREHSASVPELMEKAITSLIEMDSKRTPVEKLQCIVQCSSHIFAMLRASRQMPVGADEYLPALVYVILRANPPRLNSNITYITSFSSPLHLMSGELGYYFTNLCCAVEYIEKATATTLNVSPQQFERYVSGQVDPSLCAGLRLANQNLATLEELLRRHDAMAQEAKALQDRINSFKEAVSQEIQSMLERTPIEVKPYLVPADVDMQLVPSFMRLRVRKDDREGVVRAAYDCEEEQSANLPPPLTPTVVPLPSVSNLISTHIEGAESSSDPPQPTDQSQPIPSLDDTPTS